MMKLSQPIFVLKRRAKALSNDQQISLHEALDRIASDEGFNSWSLLAAQYAKLSVAGQFYSRLKPGDFILIGARPGQGKTLMALELAVEAMNSGCQSYFFTLEYTERECFDRFATLGIDLARFADQFKFDGSDSICADHIMRRLEAEKSGSFIVIDYLQLLDQKRKTPDLASQVQVLKSFAREKGITMAFISQIDRHFDVSKKTCPDFEDIRLPNPIDLRVFDRACFLHNGEIRFAKAS